jgi:alkylated DNA repair protein (DNA oxidative demethylase)
MARKPASPPPPGLLLIDSFVSAEEEGQLLAELERMEFGEVRMHGVVARRKVLHFGWDYDYDGWKIFPADPFPAFLEPLVARAAEAADTPRELLAQMLVAKYPPGATIGWHRDAPMFGSPVIGISLGGACTMKFRKKTPEGFDVCPIALAPRSLYVLSGAARTVWQHSIPAVKELRYSITLRTLRGAES